MYPVSSKVLALLGLLALGFLSSCIPEDQVSRIVPESFLEALELEGFTVTSLPKESVNELVASQIPTYELAGLFEVDSFKFSLYDTVGKVDFKNADETGLHAISNINLLLLSESVPPRHIEELFLSLRLPLTIYDAGVFIYPLGICLFFAVFVLTERILSLRRSKTFPRKVEKALKTGDFPNKKWKQNSASERIVWVALNENPSPESLKAYTDLEISSMERGLFILEVVIAGAPLIGLLGTVTGLVQVFSSIPDIAQGKDVLAEGIGLALLTTILGLAIAIPTLIGHAYLGRVIDKRVTSLQWVTSRINDARKQKVRDF